MEARPRSEESVTPEVHRLFEEACELAPNLRAAYVQSEASDAEVCREVLSLLSHDALLEPLFADALESAATSVLSGLDLSPGARIGAFTITRMLGRGGMGAVYLATRADGGFEQTVAIKVIQSANPTSLLMPRFQQERQILARLNHPNIARLLDGGETPDGLPYFVMEYVPGLEIDRYCSQHALDLVSQLRLFLKVCAAVQYAHENLVVHRDLKPSNILVGEDGAPKLLDFGIAKVLDPLSESAAQGSTQVLTPEYASPEQVRGEAITTAADIYSLGAVLYRLLTGQPPHALRNLSPLDAAITIAEQEVPAAPDVPTDVNAILRKALHTDPRRRYRSADDLSSDIQRYLDGKPVLAVPDSFGYRTAKFLRRRWIPVLAASAIVLALTVGAGVAIWQGKRAERRFAEVRQLSNKFLFEFEDSIHNVAGATKARELVVKTAHQYLDRLAAEAGPDKDLTRELADAYRKLGDVQGNPLESNAGDAKAALASYRKSLALRDSLGDADAVATKDRVGYLDALTGLANAESVSGDASRAVPLCERAVALAEPWIKNGSSDPELLTAAANSYSQLSNHQRTKGNFEGAMASAKTSLALKQRALALRPQDTKLLRSVATGHWAVGSAQKVAGHPEEAVASFTTTVELMRQVSARTPGNVQSRRELLGASWLLAACQERPAPQAGQRAGSRPAVVRRCLAAGNAAACRGSSQRIGGIRYGQYFPRPGSHPGTGRAASRSLAGAQARHRTAGASLRIRPGDRNAAYYLALLYGWTASAQKDLPDLNGALVTRRAAMRIYNRLVAEDPSNFDYQHEKAANLQDTGEVLAALGDYSGARALYRQGLQIAENLPKGPSMSDPDTLIADLRAADSRAAAAKK